MYRRLQILASNYGRNFGWFVEVAGEPVAALVEPRWEDMFWDSYRLVPLTTDPAMLAAFGTDQFWHCCDRLTFRSRAFDAVAEYAFAGGSAGADVRQTGRLLMRGLYLLVPCYPWDSALLGFARLVGNDVSGR